MTIFDILLEAEQKLPVWFTRQGDKLFVFVRGAEYNDGRMFGAAMQVIEMIDKNRSEGYVAAKGFDSQSGQYMITIQLREGVLCEL